MLNKIKKVKRRAARVLSKELRAVFYSCFPKKIKANHRPVIDKQNNADRKLWPGFPERGFDLLDSESIIRCADSLLDGTVELHGFIYSDSQGKVHWHREPVTKEVIPIKYARYYRFNTKNEYPTGSSDPILIFKLHTHQHLVWLSQAYAVTNDEKYVEGIINALNEWMDLFPVGYGYPYLITLNIAQRLISWCLMFSYCQGSQLFANRLLVKFKNGILLQTQYIYKQLSSDGLTNNFVLAECVAILMVSKLFPEFPDSRKWKNTAISLLKKELPKQVCDDGMSFEQSMGYQRFVVELLLLIFMLDFEELTDTTSILTGLIKSMLHLSSSSGELPQLGDISLERAFWLLPDEDLLDTRNLFGLAAYFLDDSELSWGASNHYDLVGWLNGSQAHEKCKHIPQKQPQQLSKIYRSGGFASLNPGKNTHNAQVVIDCGGVGAFNTGGHGHNDFLSFVMWFDGTPFIVDPGTYTYFSSREWRNRFRSIKSHNTVEIDGKERAPLCQGLFEMLACDAPEIVEWSINDNDHVGVFCAKHNFKVNSDHFTHARKIAIDSNVIEISDDIVGNKTSHLVWRFFCHPNINANQLSGNRIKLSATCGKTIFLECTNLTQGRLAIVSGEYSPQYGKKEKTSVIQLEINAKLPLTLNFKFSCYKKDLSCPIEDEQAVEL